MVEIWQMKLLSAATVLFTIVAIACIIVGLVSFDKGWFHATYPIDTSIGITYGWYEVCGFQGNGSSCTRLDQMTKYDFGNETFYKFFAAIARAGYAAFFLCLVGGFITIVMLICLIFILIKDEPPRVAVNLVTQNGIFGFIILTAAWIQYVIVMQEQFHDVHNTPNVDYAFILVGIGAFSMLVGAIFSIVRTCMETNQ